MEEDANATRRKAESNVINETPDKKVCTASGAEMNSDNNNSPEKKNLETSMDDAKAIVVESTVPITQDVHQESVPEEGESILPSQSNLSTENQRPEEPEDNEAAKLESDSAISQNQEEKSKEMSVSSKTSSSSVPAEQSVPRRNRCTYGSTCYRKNPLHKSKYSHPGDSDYEILDERPECRYGIRCYRKNVQHMMEFKHTKRRRLRGASKPIKPVTNVGFEMDNSSEESVDTSDYEPSDESISSEENNVSSEMTEEEEEEEEEEEDEK